MKPLGIKNQAELGKITERKPFVNNTKYLVGQLRTVDDIKYMITAITYKTKNTYIVYGIPIEKALKLDTYVDLQRRRESGQINVYIPGIKLFVVDNIK